MGLVHVPYGEYVMINYLSAPVHTHLSIVEELLELVLQSGFDSFRYRRPATEIDRE